MAKKIALLTNCTASSNYTPAVSLADAPIVQKMDDLLEWWVKHYLKALDDGEAKTPGEIYSGQSFAVVTEIAQMIGHENVFIVNRGAGLTRYDADLVPYDFSTRKEDTFNAFKCVTHERFIPSLWWGKVNDALYGDEHPITTLVEQGGYDYIVGALPMGFVKLIASDLKRLGQDRLAHQVFIPMPQSMTTIIPRDIVPATVPYDKEFTEPLSYSRTDKPQKIVLAMLTGSDKGENLEEYAEEMHSGEIVDTPKGHVEVDYKQMFADHPDLLQATSSRVALRMAESRGLHVGGTSRFTGAWRGATQPNGATYDEDLLEEGRDALKSMLVGMQDRTARDDSKVLVHIATFIQAVKEMAPTTIFTSKDVSEWAGKVMGEDGSGITRSNKVAFALRNNTEFLGIEGLKLGDSLGYRVVEDKDG